jgi:hypothetical protein
VVASSLGVWLSSRAANCNEGVCRCGELGIYSTGESEHTR